MDDITMKLLQDHLNIPLDLVIFINGWVECEKLTNENIKEAVKLWMKDNSECRFKYGHISYWDTSAVTDVSRLFYRRTHFD